MLLLRKSAARKPVEGKHTERPANTTPTPTRVVIFTTTLCSRMYCSLQRSLTCQPPLSLFLPTRLLLFHRSSQRDYVLAALAAGKHVLLNDPLSTSLSEFKEQQESAKLHGKFIQFSTMFVHQHRVRKFMDRVLYDEGFGRIHSIHSHVRLSYDDIEKVGVQLPLLISEPTNGNCIRVVGRFCVLLTTLFFSRNGCFAKSAQVRKIETTSNGLVASAECIVNYSEVRAYARACIGVGIVVYKTAVFDCVNGLERDKLCLTRSLSFS